MKNFVSNILKYASEKNFCNKLAIQTSQESITYIELAKLIKSFSNNLKKFKLHRGDRVFVCLGNTVQHLVVHYSIIYEGLVSVPISNKLPREKLISFSNFLKPKIIFTDNNFKKVSKYKVIYIRSFKELLDKTSKVDNVIEKKSSFYVNKKDLVSIMFSSGSTGQPKGIKISHESVNQTIKNIINYVNYKKSDNEIIPIPIYHNFGLVQAYCIHQVGGCIHLTNGIKSLKDFFNAFKNNYNGIAITPSILSILLSDRLQAKTLMKFKKIKYMIINTEKIPEKMIHFLKKKCPKIKLLYYYGLTEASRSCFINLSKIGYNLYKSVGKPTSDNIKIKIINEEICIKGTHLFSGYFNKKNNNCNNGYFKTGDLGYKNKEGYIFITGRKKDLINIGGLKITSNEIREALLKIESVKDAAVAAFPSKITGEEPVALVVKRKKVSVKKILQQLKKFLDNYAIPKKVYFIDNIPKSGTGKVLIDEINKIIKEKNAQSIN